MRGFLHWTEESYLGKTKDIMKYFKKTMEKVEIEELRDFLQKHLREEKWIGYNKLDKKDKDMLK